MTPVYRLDHAPLIQTEDFAELGKSLGGKEAVIDSPENFNRYCRLAYQQWREGQAKAEPAPSDLFTQLLVRIARKEDSTIMTSWGGVVITRHQHPGVEKYLVIRRGGYLALEKHELKDEHLEVREGSGLLICSTDPAQPATVEAVTPGKRFHFKPGVAHCIIALTDLLIYENSLDPKGMDKDLIFIYEPDARRD